jgi:TonB family protein
MHRSGALIFLAVAFPAVAQNPAPAPQSTLPTDPKQILEMAAPLYDYSSPDLKPFHLKATYQLYDDKGHPGEAGAYEYWYAASTVHRSTWTRGAIVHSTWELATNKYAHVDKGGHLDFAESRLERTWFDVLPDLKDVDFTHAERKELDLKGGKLDCVELIPNMPGRAKDSFVALGWFPTYCFDPHLPALRASYSLGNTITEFDEIVKWRDKYLPRQIVIMNGAQRLLSAKLETVTTLSPDDPALKPDADSLTVPGHVNIAAAMAQGSIVQKTVPGYPDAAKHAGISGTVVLQALIGRDGEIHDLRVISAPSPSLAASAQASVARWRYRPYLLNGEPVDVQTTINVIFSLGG